MMNGMRGAKPPWPVHQSVGPIKPCVMREKERENRQRQIPERICADIRINLRPARILPAPCNNAGRNAVHRRRYQRPPYLPAHLRAKLCIQPRANPAGQPCEKPAAKQIAQPDNRRHCQRGQDDCGGLRTHDAALAPGGALANEFRAKSQYVQFALGRVAFPFHRGIASAKAPAWQRT